jgi:hypothetical protein
MVFSQNADRPPDGPQQPPRQRATSCSRFGDDRQCYFGADQSISGYSHIVHVLEHAAVVTVSAITISRYGSCHAPSDRDAWLCNKLHPRGGVAVGERNQTVLLLKLGILKLTIWSTDARTSRCPAGSFNTMPMRRKIIHDSDCDTPTPSPPADHSGVKPDAKIGRHDADEGVVIVLSDSESPPATGAEAVVECKIHMNALQFAAQFGRFPKIAENAAARAERLAASADTADDDGFLWNAVPPSTSQYLDLEAVCDDSSAGSSGSSDRSLTPGFVDDIEAEKEHITKDELQVLRRFFPHTFRQMRGSRKHVVVAASAGVALE